MSWENVMFLSARHIGPLELILGTLRIGGPMPTSSNPQGTLQIHAFRFATMLLSPLTYFETTIAHTSFCDSSAMKANLKAVAAAHLWIKTALLDGHSACISETWVILQFCNHLNPRRISSRSCSEHPINWLGGNPWNKRTEKVQWLFFRHQNLKVLPEIFTAPLTMRAACRFHCYISASFHIALLRIVKKKQVSNTQNVANSLNGLTVAVAWTWEKPKCHQTYCQNGWLMSPDCWCFFLEFCKIEVWINIKCCKSLRTDLERSTLFKFTLPACIVHARTSIIELQ